MNTTKDQAGVTLAFAVVIALVVGILSLSVSKLLSYNSHQATYLENMNRAYRLAETGLYNGVGRLAVDPKAYLTSEFSDPVHVSTENGDYQNFAFRRDQPVAGAYYIVTSATRTIGGRRFVSRLHTYARVSNAGDYFAAVNDYLKVSDGVDASSGKIYAPRLEFVITAGVPRTRVLSAEFLSTLTPALIENGTGPQDDDWPAGTKAEVIIGTYSWANPVPLKLEAGIVFPQVLDGDIERYRTLAGAHTVVNNFSGDIYPPGYVGFASNAPGDVYPACPAVPCHDTNNEHHVYFYDGDITIKGVVHGQILFVATGDIYISSSLVIASGALPGAGAASSSTAHQPVLISRNRVVISSSAIKPPFPPTGDETETIQALILAPNATLVTIPYDDPDGDASNGNQIHDRLGLNFTGSLILSTISNDPPCLASVFARQRTYNYMDTLKTNPPPYLPALVEIHYSLEEAVGGGSMY